MTQVPEEITNLIKLLCERTDAAGLWAVKDTVQTEHFHYAVRIEVMIPPKQENSDE